MMIVAVRKKSSYGSLTCFAIIGVAGEDALRFILISTQIPWMYFLVLFPGLCGSVEWDFAGTIVFILLHQIFR